MRYEWQDLPERKSCFTSRNTVMLNLNTGEVIRHYSANTKIVVVQKCVTSAGTFYRTQEAFHHYLNYAFKAADLGLPNEIAPPAPVSPNNKLKKPNNSEEIRPPKPRTLGSGRKQKDIQTKKSSKGGENSSETKSFWEKIPKFTLFGRKRKK